MKKIEYWLEYFFIVIIFFIFRKFPLKCSAFFWRTFALILYYLIPSISRIPRENIKATIGKEWSDEKVEKLVKKVFQHIGNYIAEIINIPTLKPDFNRNVEIEGEYYLMDALNEGKGVVLVSGHFGVWEIGAYSAWLENYPIRHIYKKMSNPYFNKFLYNMRGAYTLELFEKKVWRQRVPEILKANEIFSILPDQDARHHGIFVPFLGQLASTYVGPAVIAARNDAPMLICFFWRKKLGEYHFVFQPVKIDKTINNKNQLLEQITKEWVSKLEQMIRKYPDQYFWFHRRWKTRPKEK